MSQKNNILYFLLFLLLVLFVTNIAFGSVYIPFGQVCKVLLGGETKSSWQYIVLEFRLPKAITAVIVGIGLSVAGLVMQTLFRNPLAGPYVLGLSSGSSLGVALVIMGSNLFSPFWANILRSANSVVIAAITGSFLVLLAILSVANKTKDSASLLIIGLMVSSFTGAIVGVLSYFSTAEDLKKYTFWSLGSIENLSWTEVSLLSVSVIIGITMCFFAIKSLDALLLGQNYAQSMGVNYHKTKRILVLSTSILTGAITAFAGPIAFVGIAVPFVAKQLFKTSNHFVLLLATAFIGAILILICDIIAQVPGSDLTLPINAITSIFGAPVVVFLLLNRKFN